MQTAEQLSACRVLVVEDDAIQALDFQLSLRQLGYEVLGPARTCADALRLLRRQLPSMAMLDIALPDGHVLPVAQELAVADVPFMLATAYSSGSLDHPLLHDRPLLRKPFTRRTLEATAAKLARNGLRKELERLDQHVASAWERIDRQAYTVSRLAAGGHDTRLAEL